MKELSFETVKLLIKAGNSNENESAIISLLNPIKKQYYINCGYTKQWEKVSQNLDTANLVALVKGLVLAERLFEWMGGSGATAIYFFREVEKRDVEISLKLADWVLHNTNNPFLPFGGHNFNAKSLVEYQLKYSRHRKIINEGLRIKKESETRAAEERKIRKKQRNKAAEHRNTEIRKKFIEELSKKNPDRTTGTTFTRPGIFCSVLSNQTSCPSKLGFSSKS